MGSDYTRRRCGVNGYGQEKDGTLIIMYMKIRS